MNLVLVAAARVVLAFTALVVIWLVPTEPARFVTVTNASLVAYLGYGIVVMVLAARALDRLPLRALAWVDVLFAGYVVALTDGTNSIFFFLFLFSILSAAFTRGFTEGVTISVVSVLLYVTATVIANPVLPREQLDRLLGRPIYLGVLGFLVSYWGGAEVELKRRLAFLSEITGGLNVRQGMHSTIDATLRRLREFFSADVAMLALKDERMADGGLLHSVSADDAKSSSKPMDVSHETLSLFMAVPGERLRSGAAWPHPPWSQRFVPLGTLSRSRTSQGLDPSVPVLANLVETNNIAVAGYHQSASIEGRLVVARSNRRFNHGEAAFLAECSRAMAAVVENVRLAEELVTQAAAYERVNLSRDLHDTTIQPYIGLRMAIEGVLRDFRDDPRVADRLGHLLKMTELGITELRDYTTRLKTGNATAARLFQSAIELQVERLARFYGIAVDVHVDPELRPTLRVEDAALHIVAEGIANVRRHTKSRTVRILVRGENAGCRMEIANELADGEAPRPFVPKSIEERVRDLGGRCLVEPTRNGWTVLTVTLPQRMAA